MQSDWLIIVIKYIAPFESYPRLPTVSILLENINSQIYLTIMGILDIRNKSLKNFPALSLYNLIFQWTEKECIFCT